MIFKELAVDNGFMCRVVFSEIECVQLLKCFDDVADDLRDIDLDDEVRHSLCSISKFRALYEQKCSNENLEIELPRNAFVLFQRMVLESMRGFCCDYGDYSMELEKHFGEYINLFSGVSHVLEESCQRIVGFNREGSGHLA
ncbi:hypothetical protein ACI3L3_16835 [Desulfobaculum sp. SPO524]|uniref:hypothetical protein n=1 Tax=Desulfobaculum sp. SPO524 TaxID=3378071 RepID=UPI003851EF60